jgi:hypothetical protein
MERTPLLQMIYDILNSNIDDEALALKFNMSLNQIRRYRAAVNVFYAGARRI